MATFQVTGGTPLYGSVRIGGAKNASYKLMLAALLADSESRLLNFSHIKDVQTVGTIINDLGGHVHEAGERALFIDPNGLHSFAIDPTLGEQGRFSSMFIAPLVAKLGKAIVPVPGGDKIGKRSLERHFDGLKAMGVTITQENDLLIADAPNGLHSAHYRFEKNSHTGTETLIMAAVKANGTTILENAAEEPEIDDLIKFINAMGGRVKRTAHRVIEIQGVEKLHGAIHKIMPDRNEAVSYACAAIATKGDVVIENARAEDLKAFLTKLDEIGAGYEIGQYGIRFFHKGELRATDVTTEIHPGFMTDWQPLWATLLTQCTGKSIIHETIMQNRFQYVEPLIEMGAQIKMYSPEVSSPEEVYNFNLEDDKPEYMHAIAITGPTPLHAGEFKVLDLRHGATLILAALIATGTSTIHGIEHVDRGYERLDKRLRNVGAQITRV